MKKRILAKVLSIVLVCVMTLTSMGAYSRTAKASAINSLFAESEVKWVSDQDKLDSILFGTSA